MSGPTAKSPDRYIHRVKDEVRGVLVFVGVIWGVFLLDRMFPFSQWFGLTPRSVVRIPGIVLMPFLHHDLGHLLGNTVTLVVLLTLLAGSRARSPAIVGALILASGGLLWLFGRNGTPDQPISHVGASGLIFGLITFLIASGIFERRLIPLAISGLVGLLYGGTLLWNVLPGTGGPNTSWDGHLLGAIAGVVVAYLWTRPTPISDLYPRVVESTAKASEGGE